VSIRISIAAIALATIACTSADAAPLEAYGQLPTLEDVKIAPDGHTVAFVRTANGRFIAIYSLESGKMLDAIRINDAKLRDVSWADAKHLLITTSTTAVGVGLTGPRQEWSMAQCFNVDTLEVIPLMDMGSAGIRMLNAISGPPEVRLVDGQAVAFVDGYYFPSDKGRSALFKVNLDSGRTQLIKGGLQNSDWIVDDRGEPVARSDYDETSQHWTLQVNTGGSWITALDVAGATEIPSMDGLSADGSAIVVSMPTGDGYDRKHVSLKDGTITAAPKSEMGVDDDIMAPSSSRIIGGVRLTDRTDYAFFQPDAEAAWKGIAAAYPDASNVEIVSWTPDWNEVVVRVTGAKEGDRYDLINLTTYTARVFGPSYDAIGPGDYAPVQWISYKASDGREISGYLTLPRNRPAKNLSLVVIPHGGPHSRDLPGFDWLSQGIASRGYAVLQPQFRGSSGFGWDLLSAGFGQFGRKMQTDLSDGVRDLTAKGIIDPKRVCIVGASYGGYAALAGATLESGVYRCAVSDAGLSDLHDFLRYMQKTSDSLNIRFWNRFLGVNGNDDPALDAISPIKHVDAVTIPILLIHGNDDTVVPTAQSEDMSDALKKAGKPVEYVELDGEDHWLSRSETRFQMLSATVKFLEANNPPN